MARKAVIAGGIVENVIEAGDDFTLPGKTLVASDTAQIGDTYANGIFTPSAKWPSLAAGKVAQTAALTET
jgi:hypothetical protein